MAAHSTLPRTAGANARELCEILAPGRSFEQVGEDVPRVIVTSNLRTGRQLHQEISRYESFLTADAICGTNHRATQSDPAGR
jgi:hypothetical protein